jgi:uncharacterized membrane protein
VKRPIEFLHSIKNKYKTSRIDRIAIFLIFLFIAVFIWLSFGKHDALKTYGNDLGFFDQIVWNTAHGHFFEYSSGMNNETNLLTTRFSLILLFFVPFYLIFSTPKWLILFQIISVAASAIPVYLIAKEKLKSEKMGLVFLISFLFYPVLHNGLLYDFHEVVFAAAFASWAFYFMEKRSDRGFIICCVLLAISQEFLALPVFMMGLYQSFIHKRWKFGLSVSAASLLYFAFLSGYLMPHLSKIGEHGMLSNKKYSYYSWLGSSLPEIIRTIVTRPGYVFDSLRIDGTNRLGYLFNLIIPVFSLGAFSWPIVIILPVLVLYVLSMTPMTYTIYFYHGVILAPFIYFSAIYTFQRWFPDDKFLRKLFAGIILIFSFGSSVIFGLSPLSFFYTVGDFIPSQNAKLVGEVKKLIPENASLSVQHNLEPHFSERRKVYNFPVMKDEADYVLVDVFDPYSDNPRQLSGFAYALQQVPSEWKDAIGGIKQSGLYDTIYDKDGWLLFRKK